MRKRGMKARVLSLALSTALAFSGILPGWFVTPTVEVQAAEVTTSTSNSYGLMDNIQDGVILHCFDWKYTDIIAELPSIAAAGFTSVQTSPAQPGYESGVWWKLYQPKGLYAATNDLGTVDELKRLCTEAHKYGIKVIVDVVANHLAGNHSYIQDDLKDSQYWHSFYGGVNWSNRWEVTHGQIGMPDFNSEHSYVQQVAARYINDLKSYGVDGIRWDAAKHIGLPSEDCNFWPAVTNQGLYHYGEILSGPFDLDNKSTPSDVADCERLMKEYTTYMSVTDSNYCTNMRNAFYNGTVYSAYANWAAKGVSNNKLVYWAESHDTYSNNNEGAYSHHMSQNVIDRTYAVMASRNEITALYFSRPSSKSKDSIIAGQKGSTAFKSAEISAVNHFHNDKNGEKDYYSTSNNCAVINRVTGAVVVAGSGGNFTVSVSNGGSTSQAGTYYDAITGEKWTVTSTQMTGKIGSSGIAVLYKDGVSKKPAPTISQDGGTFKSETLTLTLGLQNATSGTYKIGNGTAKTYTGTTTITIGSDMNVGESVTITLTATDGKNTVTKECTYTKADPTEVGNVAYLALPSGWESTVYCYVYSEDEATNNGVWPGQKMTYDSATGYYKYEIAENIKNPRVIFYSSDSHRYPADMQPGLVCNGQYLYKNGSWSVYTPPVANGTVTVKYVDEAGNNIATSKTMTGKVGDSYTTSAVTVDGYTLKEISKNASGKYTASSITVIYVYEVKNNEPKVSASVASGSSFKTETQTIELTLSNAVSGTYSVDGGPTKKFTGTESVVLGRGKIADSTVTVEATATSSDGTTKSFTFTYEKQFNGTVNEVPKVATASLAATDAATVATSQGLSKYYSTNATGTGKQATITIDGKFNDWSEDMKIAQGAAWDVANHYKGGHENCVLDTYSLYAAWDNSNIYIAWQMVNTTDTWANPGDGPLSDGGRVLDVPLILALSVDPNSVSMTNKNTSGGSIWGQKMGLEFETHVDHLLYMSGKPGLGKPSLFKAVDAAGNTNYTTGCIGFAKGGIEYKMAQGNIESNIWGLNSSSDPADVCDNSADWVDYKSFSGSSGKHDTTYDSFYEIKIPLSVLGIDKAYLEKNGIGAMLIATRGESALDCVPFDRSMLDNATGNYTADPSTSAEKDDVDVITADFAKIGNGTVTPPPVDDLELNFGANKSAPQIAGTELTLGGVAEGGKAPYTYKFYVDGTLVGTKSGSGKTTVDWTPSKAGTYEIKCIVTDADGKAVTSTKYYDVESNGQEVVDLSVTVKASATTVEVGDKVTFTATAEGGFGSYKYSYVVYNETTGKWARLKDNVTSNTHTWTAGSAGTRLFYVDVTDENGETVRSEAVRVTTPSQSLKVTASASVTVTGIGDKVKFTATAEGGSGSYKYSYIVYNKTTGSWARLADKVSSNTYTWTAKSAGTRLFYVDVTDENGNTVRSEAVTVITRETTPLSVIGSATNFDISVGETAYIVGSAEGGNGGYTYSFIVKDESTNTWKRYAFSSSNILKWTPSSAGKRTFYVEVKDADGSVIRSQAVTITVTE